MFAPTRYLEWARRFYGKVRFDLATSGMPTVPLAEIGRLPDAAHLDDVSGWARLREGIAAYNDVPPDEAVAALGTTHALWLAYAALTSPGDEVLVEAPGYEPLTRIAEGVGARVATFAREPREAFALDPGRVARAMTSRTRLVAVTNLHNPSGVRASDDVLREIARAAAARGGYLLVDEVYAPFDALVDTDGVFRNSARKIAPNVVAVGSLTKCYGLGPHRIGWLLGPREVIARADDAVTAGCGMLPLSHAHLALRAFGRIGPLAVRARAALAGKRARVASWVEAQGLGWSAPEDGLFGLALVPGAGDLTAAIEAAAREHEVLVAAGAFFGVPDGFRLAWSAPNEKLEEGLARLALALPAMRR
ncbi:MAG TPA: pyridoxal phosphate-dependent aminotransferase [Polyangiaceae bacterium]